MATAQPHSHSLDVVSQPRLQVIIIIIIIIILPLIQSSHNARQHRLSLRLSRTTAVHELCLGCHAGQPMVHGIIVTADCSPPSLLQLLSFPASHTDMATATVTGFEPRRRELLARAQL